MFVVGGLVVPAHADPGHEPAGVADAPAADGAERPAGELVLVPGEPPVRLPAAGFPPLPEGAGPATSAAEAVWSGDESYLAQLARARRVRELVEGLPVERTTGGPLEGDERLATEERAARHAAALVAVATAQARVSQLTDRRAAARLTLDDLRDDERRTRRLRERVRDQLAAQAEQLYKFGRAPDELRVRVHALLNAETPMDADRGNRYVDELFGADRELRAELDDRLGALTSRIDATTDALRALDAALATARTAIQAASVELFTATTDRSSDRDLVFPVWGEYNFIDSIGFPRSNGRRHHGADVFAAMGTPLLAVEAGVLHKVGEQGLGGWRLWIRGDSGAWYYYAHLESFAPGIRDGLRVRPGDLVGYLGDSGNARGGAPHLHFEVHAPPAALTEPGGTATLRNPYAFLRLVLDPDAEPLGSVPSLFAPPDPAPPGEGGVAPPGDPAAAPPEHALPGPPGAPAPPVPGAAPPG